MEENIEWILREIQKNGYSISPEKVETSTTFDSNDNPIKFTIVFEIYNQPKDQ